MNQFTKRDKTILVIFVLLHILVSSIARVADLNMATSTSFVFFSILYLIYIFFSQKSKTSSEVKTESVKIKTTKLNGRLLLILLVLFVIGFGFYWYEIRPSNIRSYCNWSVRWGPDKPQYGLTGERYDYLYKMCLRSRGLEK